MFRVRSDFKGKLLRVVASICSVVGVPMPSRAVKRRKFLVSGANLARAGFAVSTSDCEFTYLISSDGMQHRLRRRTMEGTYLYTHILRSIAADGEMFDVKRNIDRNQYLALLAHQDPDRCARPASFVYNALSPVWSLFSCFHCTWCIAPGGGTSPTLHRSIKSFLFHNPLETGPSSSSPHCRCPSLGSDTGKAP